jgi:hypothetical protein
MNFSLQSSLTAIPDAALACTKNHKSFRMGFQAESNLLSHTVQKGRQQQQTLTESPNQN